jgi:hypothetical protein
MSHILIVCRQSMHCCIGASVTLLMMKLVKTGRTRWDEDCGTRHCLTWMVEDSWWRRRAFTRAPPRNLICPLVYMITRVKHFGNLLSYFQLINLNAKKQKIKQKFMPLQGRMKDFGGPFMYMWLANSVPEPSEDARQTRMCKWCLLYLV